MPYKNPLHQKIHEAQEQALDVLAMDEPNMTLQDVHTVLTNWFPVINAHHDRNKTKWTERMK